MEFERDLGNTGPVEPETGIGANLSFRIEHWGVIDQQEAVTHERVQVLDIGVAATEQGGERDERGALWGGHGGSPLARTGW